MRQRSRVVYVWILVVGLVGAYVAVRLGIHPPPVDKIPVSNR